MINIACRSLVATARALMLWSLPGQAQTNDVGKYPDLRGQWRRAPVPGAVGQPPHDPSKPFGRGQEAPLTPEYQAIFEANLRDQAEGGRGNDVTRICLPNGMPRAMSAYEPLEFIVTPDITYILIDHIEHTRRIYTDGRAWPGTIEPTFIGTSIGKWVDEDGDGKYDVLEVETRGFKGPRVYEASGIPLHADNASIIRERIYLDKTNRDRLHDEITTIDHALTRPWTVTKSYIRVGGSQPVWGEWICTEGNSHVEIGGRPYFLSADGLLMPTKKGEPPPDLRYFNQSRK
jgi:hypothetical protein